LSLLGHNGAGKTTLIKILTGFHDKTSGEINVFGKSFENEYE
jgi:ABC-type multidrug transport system ATPase subunit